MIIANPQISHLNNFVGNVVQQAASVVTDTKQRCYELVDDCFSVYGFEVGVLLLVVHSKLTAPCSINPGLTTLISRGLQRVKSLGL